MRIAIATLAELPIPPVKGGAVESLIELLSEMNEKQEDSIDISIYSVNQNIVNCNKSHTHYLYYQKHRVRRFSIKNILFKIFKLSIPDRDMMWLIKQINREKYDFLIVTSIINELDLFVSCVNCNVIWYLHGDPLPVLSETRLNSILSKCYAVFSVSDYIRSIVINLKPDVKCFTIHNCSSIIPVSKDEKEKKRKEIRKKYGIENDAFMFTYIGRILPIKGVIELVKAFNKIENERTVLAIIGEPTNQTEIEYYKLIKKEAKKNICFLGYIDNIDLNMYYCASDVIVIPSICNEAAPLTLIEAELCDKPIIATKLGGIPEYISSDNIMVEYDENFVQSLCDAMKKMIMHNVDDVKPTNHKRLYDPNQYYYEFVDALSML